MELDAFQIVCFSIKRADEPPSSSSSSSCGFPNYVATDKLLLKLVLDRPSSTLLVDTYFINAFHIRSS